MKYLILASAASMALAAPALAENFGGARVEAHLGWDRVQAKVSADGASASGSDNGVVYGGEVGYDLQNSSRAVYGILAAIDGSSVKQCAAAGTERLCVKAGRDLEAGIRVGLLLAPQILLYGKVSYANVQIRASYSDSAFPSDNVSGHDSRGGIRFGAGLEEKISKRVYAKVEYRYTDYKDYRADIDGSDVRLGVSRHQVLGGVGVRF